MAITYDAKSGVVTMDEFDFERIGRIFVEDNDKAVESIRRAGGQERVIKNLEEQSTQIQDILTQIENA